MRRSRLIAVSTCIVLLLSGCGEKKEPENIIGEVTPTQEAEQEEVTLVVAGPWSDCAAIDKIAASFLKEYPNCHIEYEYLQDFENSLPTRLAGNEDKIDLFLTNNIQAESDLIPYTLELSTLGDELDLSNTFDGLVTNYHLQSSDPQQQKQFYAVPLGAEMRGMYVNTTLLDSLNLTVPTNRTEFLNACQVLQDNGYVPVQGNPGVFGQRFLYSYVCNQIANAEDYESTYNLVNSRDPASLELFQDAFSFLYSLVEKGYYNYKYCETELGLFTDISNEGCARSFLNLAETEDGFQKTDDVGQIAFYPETKSMESVIDQMKEDYHSNISYEFILSPVSDEGGYGYLSPGRGIAINASSDHIDWSTTFMNYLFQEENNVEFCEDMGFIPNTKDALDYVTKNFDVPQTQISQLGQVTFSYDFFGVINDTLVEISKGNNPKYMETKEDGSVAMYSLDYYLNNYLERLAAVDTQ